MADEVIYVEKSDEERKRFLREYGLYKDEVLIGLQPLSDWQMEEGCKLFTPKKNENSWVICDLAGQCGAAWGDNDAVADALEIDSGTLSSYKSTFAVFPVEYRNPKICFSSHRACAKSPKKFDPRLSRVIFECGVNAGKTSPNKMKAYAAMAMKIAHEKGLVAEKVTEAEVDSFAAALQNEVHLKITGAVKGDGLQKVVEELVATFLDRLEPYLAEAGFTLQDVDFVGELVLNANLPPEMDVPKGEKLQPETIDVDEEDVDDFEATLHTLNYQKSRAGNVDNPHATPKKKGNGIESIEISVMRGGEATQTVTMSDEQFMRAAADIEERTRRLLPAEPILQD